MQRQPRLDTFGALQHIIGRGIERTKIFRNKEDRSDFITRLAALCREKALVVYAWALMSNHYHLLGSRRGSFYGHRGRDSSGKEAGGFHC